jgi:hypothetical protein
MGSRRRYVPNGSPYRRGIAVPRAVRITLSVETSVASAVEMHSGIACTVAIV